jgi:hypothetical protein
MIAVAAICPTGELRASKAQSRLRESALIIERSLEASDFSALSKCAAKLGFVPKR